MKTKIPTLSQLIADRKFDYVNPDIKDGIFPKPTEIGTDYRLYHLNKHISSENAIQEMTNEGYRPATIHELLLWKDWNDKDWVVALGSVCEVVGYRRVSYLCRDGFERDLDLDWWGSGWDADFRFLGVKNISQAQHLSSETKILGKSDDLGTSDTLALEDRITKIEKWIQGIKDQLL